jgi:mono/diheme cytochrome c family protein
MTGPRRAAAAALAAALAAAGCGSGGTADDRPAAPTAGERSAAADPGLRVWAAQGCGSCHAFAPAGATGTLGPDLRQTLRGAPAAVIRRAIVDPGASAAPGYGAGMMPEDYARRMSRRELDRLVDFIAHGTR